MIESFFLTNLEAFLHIFAPYTFYNIFWGGDTSEIVLENFLHHICPCFQSWQKVKSDIFIKKIKKIKILLNNRNRWKCAINYRRRCHQSWLNILTLIVVIIMRSCVFKNWFMDLLFLGFFSITYILDSRCIPSFMSPLLNFNCTETQIVLKEPVLFGVPPPLLWWKQSFSPSQLHFRITSLV